MTGSVGSVRRRRRLLWIAAVLGVGVLILITITTFRGAVNEQRADDPRASLREGTGALGQLLTDEGVRIDVVDSIDAAATRLGPDATLVVARPDSLTADEAGRLFDTGPGQLVLLAPGARALTAFGVPATVREADSSVVVSAGCAESAATLAGEVLVPGDSRVYLADGSSGAACYSTERGALYLQTSGPRGLVGLLGGGIHNDSLDQQGNAAFAMNLLGGRSRLVWLMAAPTATRTAQPPGLLPPWWQMAATQAVLALVVLGVWRGRRLGPIMVEPLPVTVRAAETVEGHGRLYYRLAARDRAAEALRAATRTRLARGFGHAEDSPALAEAVAARTGRPAAAVRELLAGPIPTDDDALVDLATALNALEQEARQP